MNNETLLTKLNSTDTSDKIEAIEHFYDNELTADISGKLISRIADPDKAVRNAVATILTLRCSDVSCSELVPYISSADISVRNLAGEILIRNGSIAVPSLVSYLPDGNDDDKKFVIDVLGLIGDPEAAQDIYKILLESTNDNVILACLEALGRLQYEPAVNDIANKYDENELYKPTAIEALGKIGTRECLDFIVDKFVEEDVLTKYSMIESLGLLGEPDTIEFLVKQLDNCDESLVTPIIGAIYSLSEKYSIYPALTDKLKASIIETLIEGETGYKQAALSLAGELNDRDYLTAVLSIFGQDGSLDYRIESILNSEPLFVIKNVAPLLEKNDKHAHGLLSLTRNAILGNAELFESNIDQATFKTLVSAIAENLTNPDEEARKTAMELLFILDIETGLLFLDTMTADDNIWNKVRLIDILEEVFDARAEEALAKLSNDTEVMISERAKKILENRTVSNI